MKITPLSVAFCTTPTHLFHHRPSSLNAQKSSTTTTNPRRRSPTRLYPSCSTSSSSSSPPTTASSPLPEIITSTKSAIESSDGTIFPFLTYPEDHSTRNVKISDNCDKDVVLQNTTLATIPESFILTPKSCLALLVSEFPTLKSDLASLPDASVLAMGLLFVKSSKDSNPNISTLLSELPLINEVHNAYVWEENELKWLIGSPLYESALRIRDGIIEEYHSIVKFMDGNDNDINWLSQQEYAWAVAIVDSRAVRVTQAEPLVLSPLVHMCKTRNPWEKSSAKLSLNRSGNVFFSKGRNLILSTSTKLSKGNNITLPIEEDSEMIASNADCVLERGYVLDDESNDKRGHAIDLQFEISSLDRFFSDKENILNKLTSDITPLQAIEKFYLKAADDRGLWTPPDNLNPFLRLLCLSGGDAFLLEDVFRRDVWNFMQLPVSRLNEQAVCQLMIGACEDALDGYANDDSSNGVESLRKRMAKVVTDGEKMILCAAKQYYEQAEKSLDVLEFYGERRLKALDLLRPLDESEIIDSESGAQVGQAFDDNYV